MDNEDQGSTTRPLTASEVTELSSPDLDAAQTGAVSIGAAPEELVVLPPMPIGSVIRNDQRWVWEIQYKEYMPLPTDSGIEDQPPQGVRIHSRIWSNVTVNGATDLKLYIVIANNSYQKTLVGMGEKVLGNMFDGYYAIRQFKRTIPPRKFVVLEWSERWDEDPLLTMVLGALNKREVADFTIRIVQAQYMEKTPLWALSHQNCRPGSVIVAGDPVVIRSDIPPDERMRMRARFVSAARSVTETTYGPPFKFTLPTLEIPNDDPFSITIDLPDETVTPPYKAEFLYRDQPDGIAISPKHGELVRSGDALHFTSLNLQRSEVMVRFIHQDSVLEQKYLKLADRLKDFVTMSMPELPIPDYSLIRVQVNFLYIPGEHYIKAESVTYARGAQTSSLHRISAVVVKIRENGAECYSIRGKDASPHGVISIVPSPNAGPPQGAIASDKGVWEVSVPLTSGTRFKISQKVGPATSDPTDIVYQGIDLSAITGTFGD